MLVPRRTLLIAPLAQIVRRARNPAKNDDQTRSLSTDAVNTGEHLGELLYWWKSWNNRQFGNRHFVLGVCSALQPEIYQPRFINPGPSIDEESSLEVTHETDVSGSFIAAAGYDMGGGAGFLAVQP